MECWNHHCCGTENFALIQKKWSSFLTNAMHAFANKMMDGKQDIIGFHVDNPMSNHKDAKVNNKFPVWLNEKCGSSGKVKVAHRNKLTHSGMKFKFRDGKVVIDMVKCALLFVLSLEMGCESLTCLWQSHVQMENVD